METPQRSAIFQESDPPFVGEGNTGYEKSKRPLSSGYAETSDDVDDDDDDVRLFY